MASKQSSSYLQLAITCLPTILSVLYFQWDSISRAVDINRANELIQPLYSGPIANVSSPFDILRDQYTTACPKPTFKTRVFSTDPLIIYLEDFITASERAYLLNLAAPQYEASAVAVPDSGFGRAVDSDYRSSHTAFLDPDPVIRCIQQRSAAFQGHVPIDHFEAIQVVKYGIGEQFREHHDSYGDEENPRETTIFAYLACDSGEIQEGSSIVRPQKESKSCVGGHTQFTLYNRSFSDEWCDVVDCKGTTNMPGVAFSPVEGNAIFWSNLHPNGTHHAATLHAGMPVKRGRKVGLNIWTHRDKFDY